MKFKNFFQRKERKLLFIFGCPRGGTTWLWSLFESHKDVLPFVDGVVKNKDGKYSTSESGIYVKRPLQAKKEILNFLNENKGYFIIEKTPLHTLSYNKIINDFPKANYLIIYRNPIAIVNSMVQSNMEAFKDYDIEKSISEVKKYYSSLVQISENHQVMEITYEDLYSDTELVLKNLFNEFDLSSNSISEIISFNDKKSPVNVKGVLRKGNSNSFQTDLQLEQKQYIKSKLKKEISIYNTKLKA